MDDEAIMSTEFDSKDNEFHSEDDSTKTMFDEKPLIDGVEVNMINCYTVVDEDIDLGHPDQTNNNKEVYEDNENEPSEVLDNDMFESVASEQEMYDKLKNGSECGDLEDWVNKCY
ncbi:unnamed protein product [Lactuca virosa]|uniref:Uncharacterized protein n=1 Tax=Lactuca virosa TaxID=75947 RepID=A0AAU9PJ26_9ASTR|nr:unnamed protein product [Lactuca virosa]